MSTETGHKTTSRFFGYPLVVFATLWVAVFALYLPAAHAGRVGDFPGWVDSLRNRPFFDYLNRTGTTIPSMYHFTQLVTWLFYQAFGSNAWLWHLLYVSLQAANGLLLYVIFRQLFTLSSVRNPGYVSFAGALLFCLCPHISEVVVWEPSFHYLLGLLLMLVVVRGAQLFIVTQKIFYVWLCLVVFILSALSLEVFYLTPAFVFTLALYYCHTLEFGKPVLRKILLFITLPQLVLFAVHIALLRVIYHENLGHIRSLSLLFDSANLSKPPKYLFHILFFGRFFSAATRSSVYHFCESVGGLATFYGVLLALAIFLFKEYRKSNPASKAAVLLFVWILLSLGLVMPLWFQDTGLVIYDRYTYVIDAFIYTFLALLLGNSARKEVFLAVAGLYALANIRFTHKVNAYWQQSARIVNNLVTTFPNDTARTVLLLNLPECLGGVQMIGTRDDGEFRMMYNALMPHNITNTVYDVEAFYMASPGDGAHVIVVNDSTIKVTLNQWGTWWLYYGYGATSYENKDYKVIMRDQGHWYDLVLKRPADEYLLLFSVGDQWRAVNWSLKNVDQY